MSLELLSRLRLETAVRAPHAANVRGQPGVDSVEPGRDLRDLARVSHTEESFQKSSESSIVLTFSTFATRSGMDQLLVSKNIESRLM